MRDTELSTGGSALLLAALGSVSQVLSFCYRVALSRLVGAEVMGLYQLLMPVYSVLLSLTAVGVTAAVSNLTAQYLALHDRRGADQARRLALRIFLLALVPVSVAVVVWSDPISVYLLGDARTQLGLMLLVPCVLLTGVENIHKHCFYGGGQVRPPALTELLEQAIRAVAVLGLLLLFPGAWPERRLGLIVLGMVGCEIFSAMTLSILYRRWIRRRGLTGPGERGRVMLGRVGAIALPVGANALLGNLMGAVNTTLIPRKLVEGGMIRSQAISQFGVVCGMTLPMLSLPTVVLGALNLVLIPRLSHCMALDRPREVHRLIHRALLVVSASMLPAMAMLAVIGPDLGRILFGQEGAGAFLLPLSAAMALSCYHSTFAAVLNGVGHQTSSALISLLCGAGQLLSTVLAVPVLGIEGFVLGTLATSLLGAVLSGWRVVRSTGLPPQIFQWVTAPGLAALLMALCCNLLLLELKGRGMGVLGADLAVLVFGAVLYLAALQAQGVRPREVFRLKSR